MEESEVEKVLCVESGGGCLGEKRQGGGGWKRGVFIGSLSFGVVNSVRRKRGSEMVNG